MSYKIFKFMNNIFIYFLLKIVDWIINGWHYIDNIIGCCIKRKQCTRQLCIRIMHRSGALIIGDSRNNYHVKDCWNDYMNSCMRIFKRSCVRRNNKCMHNHMKKFKISYMKIFKEDCVIEELQKKLHQLFKNTLWEIHKQNYHKRNWGMILGSFIHNPSS